MRKQTKIAAMVSAAALLAIGASVTSLAAWQEENGVWIYRDRYGDPEEGWHRYTPTGAWCYADEDGVLVTNELIGENGVGDYSGDLYYVGSDGGRVTDTWISIPNYDDEMVNDETPDTLYYYIGSKGIAYKANPTQADPEPYVVKTGVWTTNAKTAKGAFIFDEYGHMVTGYVDKDDVDSGAAYYCVTPDDMYGEIEVENSFDFVEGQALTGWVKMLAKGDDYNDDPVWFYFASNGKRTDGDSKYLSWKGASAWYTFNDDGELVTKNDPVTASYANANGTTESSGTAYVYVNGTSGSVNGNGWVYNSGDDEWYYIVNIRDANHNLTARGVKFNDQNTTIAKGGTYAAKKIGGKTFLFDSKGVMVTGPVTLTEDNMDADNWWMGFACEELQAGEYFFYDVANTGRRGELTTGKITYEDSDGEEHTKYYTSTQGALTNVVVDGYVYDRTGHLFTATDGDSYAMYPVTTSIEVRKTSNKVATVQDSIEVKDCPFIIVDKNGKIVRNKSTVELSTGTYTVVDYVVSEKTTNN